MAGSEVVINGTPLGTQLTELLLADEIVPGAAPSYQLCKTIYLYHPLGLKMAEAPISIAQSKQRKVVVAKAPSDRVAEAFVAEWDKIKADRLIFNVMRQSRIYGVSSLALLADGVDPAEPLDLTKLADADISFNVFDPLNTSGSLVLNQDPNAIDFQKHRGIAVAGRHYHRSREVTILNEDPIYIAFTASAFGYVGRSVYQRALFPLKSFVNSMVTDDMVVRKAGLIVAMIQQGGAIIDRVMGMITGIKRNLLREAQTNNVLSIGTDEKIETLDMQNVDGAFGMARGNILKNIATAADMPAVLIENETLTEGFGEGTEDAKVIAKYVDRVREQMKPVYDFLDTVVQYRAWTPAFFRTLQAEFPEELGGVDYTTAFYDWRNSFVATWPSLLTEPDSEKAKAEETKLDGVVGVAEMLLPLCDPLNKARVAEWIQGNLNENKTMFAVPLDLDFDALAAYTPPVPGAVPGADEDGEDGTDGADDVPAPKPGAAKIARIGRGA